MYQIIIVQRVRWNYFALFIWFCWH